MTEAEQMIAIIVAMLAIPIVALCWKLLRRALARAQSGPKKWAIIDGSNVMHWKDGEPQIDTVRKVVELLIAKGFTPGVMFDANAGYLLIGKYQHDGALSRALGLPQDHVIVVPKGTQADPAILTAARDFKGRVVSNDRFRDWAQDFPEIRQPGYLIHGGFRSGTLSLNFASNKSSKPRTKRRNY